MGRCGSCAVPERVWFGVQGRRCDECGLDVAAVPETELAVTVGAEADAWRAALGGDVRRRPAPEVWSPLECACHVRDVFRVFAERVGRMLTEDEPELGYWDHDASVVEQSYNEHDPVAVLDDLEHNASLLAAALDDVPPGAWERTGIRRAGERFTIAGLARFALHESHHHRSDATGVRLAEAGDADVVASILAQGFADDPVLSWMVGGVGRDDKLLPFFDFIIREANIPLGATWITREATGCACWTPPGGDDWPRERSDRFGEVLRKLWDGADFERLGALNAVMEEHRPSEPHWYLGSIAAMPAARGQGVGRRLLAAGLAVTDRDGLPAYLESSNPRNVSIYERHGFEVTERVDLPEGPPLTLMWRTAR